MPVRRILGFAGYAALIAAACALLSMPEAAWPMQASQSSPRPNQAVPSKNLPDAQAPANATQSGNIDIVVQTSGSYLVLKTIVRGAAKLSRETLLADYYDAIMTYVRAQKIGHGTKQYIGKGFAAVYAEAVKPKALAVCLDLKSSTHDRLVMAGAHRWQFVTATGRCGPRNADDAARCALSECTAHARCGAGQQCFVVDVDDKNVLQLPPSLVP